MKLIAKLALGVFFTGAIASAGAPAASAAVGNWQKGVTIQPRSAADFGSQAFKQSVGNAAGLKANYVTLVVPYYQSNLYSTDVGPGWNTPTDESLIAGINYARSLGLKVMLKPHVDSYTGEWRANINPSDRESWFANYGKLLAHLAEIAQQTKAEQLCVGSELIRMSSQYSNQDNTRQWNNLISQVKKVYGGKLTYSANWGPPGTDADEKPGIGFWPQLDYAGIAAYYNLNQAPNNSAASLENAWNSWLNSDIQSFANRIKKPVLFTEIGYKSVSGGHNQPWDFNWGGSADQDGQANSYTALFNFWNKQNFMAGVHLWDWSSDPNAGGSGNTDYTPQNKQAQSVIAQWFGGSSLAANTSQTAAVPTASWPSGTLVLDNGTIYLIAGQNKFGFASMNAFTGLGYALKNVSKGDTSGFLQSSMVLSSASQAHPASSWVINNGTVYYVANNGLIPVPSWQIFIQNGGQAKFIIKANAADLGLARLDLMKGSDPRVIK